MAKGINVLHEQDAHRAMMVVTHQERLLKYIVPDFVHVIVDGRIVESGGKELALRVEEKGYAGIEEDVKKSA